MLGNLIIKKAKAQELSLMEYYEVVDYLLKNGADELIQKFFLGLHSFGMTDRETYYLTLAMRDSGRVLKFNQCILEKHSTGGVADATSVVIIPLLACLGYKIIKTTGKSFVFTNGSADRFGAIPNFKTQLTDSEIKSSLEKTNACVLSHNGDMCPADRILFDVREQSGLSGDINLLASSIACKKLASGAKAVLVDVKYGNASLIEDYKHAKELARLLKYIFKKCNVKSTIVITNTYQTIGEGVGNSVEVVDALNVLQGRKCLLRDISVLYTTEMIKMANPKLSRKQIKEMIDSALDNGLAYKRFLEIVQAQGGDSKIIEDAKLFNPYNSINFVSDKDGYVGTINAHLLGELIRRLCVDSHDSNIGAVLRVKIGDYVNKGDIIVSFYYKDKKDFEKYRNAIAGCVRITSQKIKPIKVVKKVIR